MASFPNRFPPERVAELKRDRFYGGLPKRIKVMVAYLKMGPQVRTYSDYLRATREAEKEDTIELSQSPRAPATDSPSKLRATSYFPLRKLKGNQPFMKKCSLLVGLITDPMGAKVACVGLGNAYTRPLGYVIIWVQVYGVWGYDEDQIALIIPDFSNFAVRVPIILGTPTIGQVVNVMKEVEMDALAMPWVNARVAHLLAIRRMAPVKVESDHNGGYITRQDGFMMHTQKVETLEPFSSHVIPMKTMETHVGECLNMMVQALYDQDGTLLPGLMVQNMYTKLRKGSKKAVVVVQNHTADPQTLQKKMPVARAIPVQLLTKTPKPGSLPVPDEACSDLPTPKLMIRQRCGKLFDELDLSGLDLWAPKLEEKAHQLLAEYHNVFLLDLAELGCTHSTEHTIKVTDDTPFKECFRRIPPPMVEEVRNHLKEMLESVSLDPARVPSVMLLY